MKTNDIYALLKNSLMEVQIHNKRFEYFMSEDTIQKRIKALSVEINKDYHGKRPIFISILNGAFWFTTDLFKHIEGDCELTFVKIKSYQGTETTGQLVEKIGLDLDIRDRDIILVEDIVDTGTTLNYFLEKVKDLHPGSLKIASLLLKPNALRYSHIKVDYLGFEIPNYFVVGYGFDYDGLGRNYRNIYKEKR